MSGTNVLLSFNVEIDDLEKAAAFLHDGLCEASKRALVEGWELSITHPSVQR